MNKWIYYLKNSIKLFSTVLYFRIQQENNPQSSDLKESKMYEKSLFGSMTVKSQVLNDSQDS